MCSNQYFRQFCFCVFFSVHSHLLGMATGGRLHRHIHFFIFFRLSGDALLHSSLKYQFPSSRYHRWGDIFSWHVFKYDTLLILMEIPQETHNLHIIVKINYSRRSLSAGESGVPDCFIKPNKMRRNTCNYGDHRFFWLFLKGERDLLI